MFEPFKAAQACFQCVTGTMQALRCIDIGADTFFDDEEASLSLLIDVPKTSPRPIQINNNDQDFMTPHKESITRRMVSSNEQKTDVLSETTNNSKSNANNDDEDGLLLDSFTKI